MTDAQRASQTSKQASVENLELNRETLQELTEGEAEGARGGEWVAVRPSNASPCPQMRQLGPVYTHGLETNHPC